MKYIKKMKIDIDKNNPKVIPSVQYDSNTRYLHINIMNGSIPLNLTGCSVKIAGAKPDGTAIFNNCNIINAKEGFIEVELTEQLNAVAGTVKAEIKVYDTKGVLTTKHFDIYVSASVTSKEITSSNEFKALTDAFTSIDNKVNINGVGEVKWANIAQDARENISGDKVAIVGVDSVGTVNVVDNSMTSTKRTCLGEWGVIQGQFGKCELDLENRKLILPPNTGGRFVTFRNTNYNIPSEITEIDVSFGHMSNATGGFIFFDTLKNEFITGNINKVNENCIFIGYIWWDYKALVQGTSDKYYQPEPICSINGLSEDIFFGQHAQVHFKSIMEIDHENRKIKLHNGAFVTYKNINKFIEKSEIDISCGDCENELGCFLFFDPETDDFITTLFIETINKRCLYIGYIWWPSKVTLPNANGEKYQPEPYYSFNIETKTPINHTYVNGRYGILNTADSVIVDLHDKKIKFSNPNSFIEIYDGYNYYGIAENQRHNGVNIDFEQTDGTKTDAGYIYFNTTTCEIEYKTKQQSLNKTSLLNCIFLGVIFLDGSNIMLNFSNYKIENYVNVLEYSKWKGKTINILGDSITEGKGTTIKYADLLAKALGCTVRNYGISGSTISRGHENNTGSNPMSVRFSNMDNKADGIIMFGGTNDFGWRHTPLGTLGDSDNTSFYGALKVLIEGLINKYPKVPIMFITPLHRADGDGNSENTPNVHGKKLIDYVNAIKEVCEIYSIKVCDLWAKSGIQPNLAVHKDLYTSKTTGWADGDGLHPNEEGHMRITPIIANDFNELL